MLDPGAIPPEAAEFAALFWGIASSAIVGAITEAKKGSDGRRKAAAAQAQALLDAAKTPDQLLEGEIGAVARALNAQGEVVGAMVEALGSDEVLRDELTTWVKEFAADPTKADEAGARAFGILRDWGERDGLAVNEAGEDVGRLMTLLLMRARTVAGPYLEAVEHRVHTARLEEIGATIDKGINAYLTYQDFFGGRTESWRLLLDEEELDAKYRKRVLSPFEGGDQRAADDVFREFLESDGQDVLAVLGAPGVGKTQQLVHWCRLTADETDWEPRVLDDGEFQRAPDRPLPDVERLVLFMDYAGRAGSLSTLISMAGSRTGKAGPAHVKVVLADWTRYGESISTYRPTATVLWRLDPFENDAAYDEFLRSRFDIDAARARVEVAAVSEGNPELACEAWRLAQEGLGLGGLSGADFMKGVVRDWRKELTKQPECRGPAARLIDAVAMLDGVRPDQYEDLVAIIKADAVEVARLLDAAAAFADGDLLVREEGKVLAIRPDVWRLQWLRTFVFCEKPRWSPAGAIATLLPLAPEGVISGLLGVTADPERHDLCVRLARKALAPAIFARLSGVEMLGAFTTVYGVLDESDLPIHTADLKALDAAAHAVAPGRGSTLVMAAASRLAQRGRPREALPWFSKHGGKLGTTEGARLANNWGSALAEAASLEQSERDAAGARGLLAESFEKFALAVKSEPDMHAAAYNWGSALANAARLEQSEGDAAGARALFAKSFEKYALALAIKPDRHEAASNWGAALADAARLERSEGDAAGARALFAESFERCGQALAIEPAYHEAANNWGAALADLADMLEGAERVQRVDEAFGRIDLAIELARTAEDMDRVAFYSAHFAYEALGASSRCLTVSKRDRAREMLRAAAEHLPDARPDLGQKELVRFFGAVCRPEYVEFCVEALELLRGAGLEDYGELLEPFRLAVEYWRRDRDALVLDRLNPELREVVEEIVRRGEAVEGEDEDDGDRRIP